MTLTLSCDHRVIDGAVGPLSKGFEGYNGKSYKSVILIQNLIKPKGGKGNGYKI